MKIVIFLLFLFSILPGYANEQINNGTIIQNITADSNEWVVFHCEDSICDLSNWFAELLFGVIIGLGILTWQRLEHRKRSSYFVGEIYDLLFPLMYQLYNILTSDSLKKIIRENPFEYSITKLSEHTHHEDDDVLYILTADISDKEFEEIIKELAEIKKIIPKLEQYLSASGDSISGKLQEQVAKLAFDLDFEFKHYPGDRYHIASEMDLLLGDVMIIMRHNKKKLKKELNIDDKYYKKVLNEFQNSEIILTNFDTEKLKNYYLWYIMDSLAKKQRDWFNRP